MVTRFATLCLALAGAAAPALPAQRPGTTASLPGDLDAFVARVMREFQVPGLALAVVKDGRVLVAKGYGVRRLGAAGPVDARTLFGIASNTKAFTATALAMLVEEGKIAWDAPVIRYLPDFAMHDPWVTRELTVRDLLVHRSGLGLGAGDLLWWPPSTYTRAEIARRIRHIPPATSFRSAYAYDNVLYIVAGELIERVTGQRYEDFVEARILRRVGMTGSNVHHSKAVAGAGNVSATHATVEGRVREIAPFLSDNTNAAGGINAGAEDMARWMVVQLDSGRLADGTRLFSQRSARELWTIVVPRAAGSAPPELPVLRRQFSGYALGFGVADHRGEKLLQHSGGLPGYISLVTMIPDRKLGIAVLTNHESLAMYPITWRLVDHLLGAPAFDYLAAYLALDRRTAAENAASVRAAAAKRDTASRPSLPLGSYAGTYRDDWYGDIAIAHEDGRLVIRFTKTPSLVGDLVHWQHDTFLVRWRDRELRADAYITFALNVEGSIREARMEPASPEVDFSFDFQDLLLRPTRRD